MVWRWVRRRRFARQQCRAWIETPLNSARTAVNSVSVTCTAGTIYSVGLGNGSSGGTGPTTRLMGNAATSEKITYGIYRDSSYAMPWGNVAGTDTVSATGTGTAQNYSGYGRVPVQTTPPPLTYTDTVVVTGLHPLSETR